MAENIKRHLSHLKSSGGTAPEATDIVLGEIAVGYKKDSEALYIKNSSEEIVTFSSDGQFYKKSETSGATEISTALDGKQNTVAKLGSATKPIYTSAAGTFKTGSTYAGGTKITLNGENKGASTATIYAPTSAGTAGQVLLSTAGEPSWTTLSGSNVTLTPDATNDKLTIGITKSNVTTALGYTPPTGNTTYSFDGTYNESTNKAATVSSVTTRINAISGSSSGSTSKTITAITQTGGIVTPTYADISITKSQVSDFPSSMTPTAHNQASNTITAMTSYSKPSSTSAIVSGDTLNGAIGKLEKGLDGIKVQDGFELYTELATGLFNTTSTDYYQKYGIKNVSNNQFTELALPLTSHMPIGFRSSFNDWTKLSTSSSGINSLEVITGTVETTDIYWTNGNGDTVHYYWGVLPMSLDDARKVYSIMAYRTVPLYWGNYDTIVPYMPYKISSYNVSNFINYFTALKLYSLDITNSWVFACYNNQEVAQTIQYRMIKET